PAARNPARRKAGGPARRPREQPCPAKGIARPPSMVRCPGSVGAFRLGDQSAALHVLDRAEGFAGRSDTGDSPWPWTHPFGHGGLDGYRGAIAARLKLPEMALPALQRALGTQNPGQVDKYRALVLGDLAMSYLPTGEVEESVRLTAEAFDIGSQL